jgi:hypothetical protein
MQTITPPMLLLEFDATYDMNKINAKLEFELESYQSPISTLYGC